MNGNLAVATQKCGGWANCVISHTMWPAMTAFSIDSQTLMLHFWSHYSPISRPLFGDKASQPFETRLSALRNIEINFAPLRHAGFANFRECHQTCAEGQASPHWLQLLPDLTIVASHHCANQNQHDSDLFVDFLRKWSGTQVSRMRNMTRKQTESKQSGHRCISHRVPWCTELKRSNITVGLPSA